VVDDDARLAASLRSALAYEGYTVDVAADDPAALVVARDQPPDLVVLDVMLPGLDGVEVCRRLRAGSDLPALMLTARDAVSDRVAGLDAGAWSSRRKEFEKHRLCAGSLAMLDKSAGNASSSKS
jgi:two-component system response regulator MprA